MFALVTGHETVLKNSEFYNFFEKMFIFQMYFNQMIVLLIKIQDTVILILHVFGNFLEIVRLRLVPSFHGAPRDL